MAQHVTVREYDPLWPIKYQEERTKIEEILGENCLAIYHIGSTSVPGLSAKPVTDIMAAVRSLEYVDEKAEDFKHIGYEYMGEFGIEGRRYLRKGGDERTHQLHIFSAEDTDNICRHLAFRAYLCAHKDVRDEYSRLKTKLAELFPYDIESYCDGKVEFVKKTEKAALAEYDSSWDRLYLAARKVQGERKLSDFLEAGSVAAALMTEAGNIYVGVCIDTACSLGMCAERNAAANMITNGEKRIKKLVAVMPDKKAGLPCGACMEFLMQLDEKSPDIEILTDYERGEKLRLKDIMPSWWRRETDTKRNGRYDKKI